MMRKVSPSEGDCGAAPAGSPAIEADAAAHLPVDEISPAEARMLVAHGAVWVDVREAEELEAFAPMQGAVHLPRAKWTAGAASLLPDKARSLIVYCGRGERGVLAARSLIQHGHTQVRHVRGGLLAIVLDEDDPSGS